MRQRICTVSELDSMVVPVLPTKIKTHNTSSKETFYEKQVDFSCETDGSGFWSSFKKKINHNKICLVVFDSSVFELRVYFYKKYWDVKKNGLVYTDKMWIKNLENNLCDLGFYKSFVNLDYSEQGMQGDNYVSLDINSKNFIQQYFQIFYSEKDKMLDSFSSSLEKIYF